MVQMVHKISFYVNHISYSESGNGRLVRQREIYCVEERWALDNGERERRR
jgi:hypothetical protein